MSNVEYSFKKVSKKELVDYLFSVAGKNEIDFYKSFLGFRSYLEKKGFVVRNHREVGDGRFFVGLGYPVENVDYISEGVGGTYKEAFEKAIQNMGRTWRQYEIDIVKI